MVLGVAGLVLAGCATRRPVKVLDRAALSSDVEQTIVSPRRQLPETRAVLEQEGLAEVARASRDEAIRRLDAGIRGPADYEKAIAAAELCLEAAYPLREKDLPRSLGYALTVAEFATRVVPRNTEVLSADEDALLRVYNFVARRTAEIAHRTAARGEGMLIAPGPLHDYRLRLDPDTSISRNAIDLAEVDAVYAEDRIVLNDVGRIYRRTGLGGAVTVYAGKDVELSTDNPFIPPNGIAVPATALLTFPSPGEARLTVIDGMEQSRITINGQSVPLAADYSAPFAVLQSKGRRENIGLGGLLDPDRFAKLRGLYSLQRMKDDRIPLVFVHGLMSSPATWRDAVSTVLADDVLREHYHVYLFYYPTGLPIGYNAAQLRKAMAELEQVQEQIQPNPNFDRMVMIGHSMGGILANAQIRNSGDVGVRKVFTTDIDDVDVSEEERTRIKDILVFDANPNIDRVIFVCAPHRGSDWATNWVGRLGSRLIKVPLNLVVSASQLNFSGMANELTDAGRTMLATPGNSVKGLRPGSSVLTALMDMEMAPDVPYHSIVGDRGRPGPLEDSSDGIVPYWSSHLDGAVSEKVVPAPHSATAHPETIEEIRRILYLHLGRTDTPPPLEYFTGQSAGTDKRERRTARPPGRP